MKLTYALGNGHIECYVCTGNFAVITSSGIARKNFQEGHMRKWQMKVPKITYLGLRECRELPY